MFSFLKKKNELCISSNLNRARLAPISPGFEMKTGKESNYLIPNPSPASDFRGPTGIFFLKFLFLKMILSDIP